MSLARDCRNVVSRYPYMMDGMREGIVNYRALARRIKPEVESLRDDEVDIEAVTTALRRYSQELENDLDDLERVRRVLSESRVSLRGNVVSITGRRIGEIDVEAGFLHLVRGRNFTTVVTDDTHADEVKEKTEGELIQENRNLTGITVESPEEITRTPGVLSHLVSRFMSEGINIVEITSCYTETIIVVDRNQAVRALETLEDVIETSGELLGKDA
ncbi:MAG: hypothetical protein SV377_06865 [Halobacteria archaeon]|nr:hypothetical protein [Halobacteria archaeon]